METIAEVKSTRLLEIYARLVHGDVLSKAALSLQYHVSERSVQRDMESLRAFVAHQGIGQDVIYDYKQKGYRLIQSNPKGLTNDEILAVCKILLESRSLRRDEMLPILDKLVECAVPAQNQKLIDDLILNETFHYIPPHHDKRILHNLWALGEAVRHQQVLEIEYERMKDHELVKRRVQPVGIMFSEYYFYLTAFLEDKSHFENPGDLFPTIYRIDRIVDQRITDTHFPVIYANRFQEGEMRKRIQFMYGGPLVKIRFAYTGPNLESILDKLPTARQTGQDLEGHPILEAEVYDGQGFQMWLRSQGEWIQRIEKF